VTAAAALDRLRRSSRPRILFVSHAYGGGVRRHIEELAAAIEGNTEVLLLTPRAASSLEVRWLRSGESLAAWPAKSDWERTVAFLESIGIDRVHFHHVHGLPSEALELPKRLGCAHDLTLHDHFPACPQYHMQDGAQRFCGGEPGCEHCLEQGPAQWPVSIQEWRALFRPVLEGARKTIAPSEDTARRIAGFFPGCAPVVWPHPRVSRTAPPRALRVIVPGAISPAKGLPLLVACAKDAAARRLPVHFHVVGYVAHPVPLWPEVPLTIGGEYREGELPALLAACGGDAIFFPAQVPESFSFTLTDALDTGLPIVATNLGALPERLANRKDARIVPWNAAPGEVNDALLRMRTFAAPAPATSAPSFEDYAGRYLEGLRRGAPPARPMELPSAWLEAPVESDPPTTTLAWLFDDAFLCGRALSRDKLKARLR
jgi:glycosyltransferase involved in cell wall biosynthesis